MFKTITQKIRELTSSKDFKRLNKKIDALYDAIDVSRSRLDLDDDLLDKFFSDKKSKAYQSVYEKEFPLVTVCVCTYNRGRYK